MDIFFECSQKIQVNQEIKFQQFAVLNEYAYEKASDFLLVLKHMNGESLALENDNYEIVFDGYIPGIKKPELSEKLYRFSDYLVNGKAVDYNEYSGLFNICIRDKRDGKVYLKSDPFAVLPLYYCLKDGNFYYSSHGHILGSLVNAEPDFGGIMQKFVLGYTLGEKYYYKNIYRLNPGETIIYDQVKGKIISSYNYVYYSEYNYNKNKEEEIFSSLLSSFEKIRQHYSELGLMLSEGFDSRFLGGIARIKDFKIHSYTHGTPGAGGQYIVDQLSKALHSDHHFQSMINGYNHSDHDLREQVYLADNLNYPF